MENRINLHIFIIELDQTTQITMAYDPWLYALLRTCFPTSEKKRFYFYIAKSYKRTGDHSTQPPMGPPHVDFRETYIIYN